MSGLPGVLIVRLGLVASLIYLQLIMSTEVIPERAEVYDVNEKYLKNVTAYIRRTGRRSPYYIHAGATTLDWFGENISIHAVFYEYLHNEYKRSFVELDMTLCDLVIKEPWRTLIGVALEKNGLTCPLPPGTYKFQNLSIATANFPYVWPFEKAMLQGYAKLTTTQEILVRERYYLRFKRDIPKWNEHSN